MLLSPIEFHILALRISELTSGHVGADVETTGLSAYKGDKAFILGITDEKGEKFCVYTTPDTYADVALFCSNPRIKYCCHNQKFEMSFLAEQFKTQFVGVTWDSEVNARLAYDKPVTAATSFSLQNCAKRAGLSKHEPMLEWLKLKGNKAQYHKAPAEIIEPYVCTDAWLSWELCRQQIEIFKHYDISGQVSIKPVVKLELEVLKPLFEMENFGLLVDVNFCVRALEHERTEIEKAKAQFQELTKTPFVDSRKTLAPVFDARGISYGKTEKGNPSFTSESIRGSDEVTTALFAIRSAQKRASSYWENFLDLEHNGLIHPSINQNRARTGRMSISDPSAQNWPTDNDEIEPLFPVRRAFIARPDCKIVSLDWAGVELRLMCDEAEDMEMIDAIRTGKDFHQAVADAAKVPRSLAKNGRFAKLYGAGVPRVALTLGVDEDLARTICREIDATSEGVARYVRGLIRYAEKAPYCYDALGRRFYFERGFAYKFPNFRIQGLCGELLKRSIIGTSAMLGRKKSSQLTSILIPIHDELVLNMHNDDLHLIPEIKQIMIDSYLEKKHLALDVGVFIGDNFYDLEELKL